jgi:hypothetical protein
VGEGGTSSMRATSRDGGGKEWQGNGGGGTAARPCPMLQAHLADAEPRVTSCPALPTTTTHIALSRVMLPSHTRYTILHSHTRYFLHTHDYIPSRRARGTPIVLSCVMLPPLIQSTAGSAGTAPYPPTWVPPSRHHLPLPPRVRIPPAAGDHHHDADAHAAGEDFENRRGEGRDAAVASGRAERRP